MPRRSLMIGATALLLATAATPAAADDRFTAALLQQVQAPAAPAPRDAFSGITLGHVLGTLTGAVAGKVLLEGVFDLPMGVGLVAGGIAGYYLYVKYVEPMGGPGVRRTSAPQGEARMFLIGDAVIESTSWILQPPRPAR